MQSNAACVIATVARILMVVEQSMVAVFKTNIADKAGTAFQMSQAALTGELLHPLAIYNILFTT